MRLWLDDLRPHQESWARAKSVNEAIVLMENNEIEFATLDHDLGDWASDGGDGYKLVHWMIENDRWPSGGIRVHSSNPVGVERMLSDIKVYGPYDYITGNYAGSAPAEGWPSTDTYE